MCGICGFFSKSSSSYNNIIDNMSNALLHRGPDNKGTWRDEKFGLFLGHQRLSILDLSNNGNQPMVSKSNRFIIIFNGEIYNHLKLREEVVLKNSSFIWRGGSDTETLLASIENWGIEKTLKKIVGMFAFAIWDKKERCLTLARDRIGEKPLYYGWQSKTGNPVFLFGSELKSLKAHPEFEKNINHEAINLQMKYSFIPAPYTIYKNIYKLLPGHFLQLRENNFFNSSLPKSQIYYSFLNASDSEKKNFKNINNIQSELHNLLKQTIKDKMISDVPIGAFLSGGIDSSLIVSLMKTCATQPVKTFTIGFSDQIYDEAKFAKQVAKHLGTDHTELYLSDKDILSVIPNLANVYDEPFADSSQIPTYLISKIAKKSVTVCLTGDGGDELFCGYNRYNVPTRLWNIYNLLPFFFKRLLIFGLKLAKLEERKFLLGFFSKFIHYQFLDQKIIKLNDIYKSKNIFEFYDRLITICNNSKDIVLNSNEPLSNFAGGKIFFNNINNQQIMMALDIFNYLPDDILVKVDRAAMSNSLETRAPFLDHRIVDFAWQMPQSLKFKNGKGKWILREILNYYIPKKLIKKNKSGFSVPIDNWLRGPLRHWAENLLDEKKIKEQGYLNSKIIKIMWIEHINKKKNLGSQLWNVLMFQLWLENN
jgi:asparagine synthase (glutamine-hydrolysing)